MKKIIRLTESDLTRIVRRVIQEQAQSTYDYETYKKSVVKQMESYAKILYKAYKGLFGVSPRIYPPGSKGFPNGGAEFFTNAQSDIHPLLKSKTFYLECNQDGTYQNLIYHIQDDGDKVLFPGISTEFSKTHPLRPEAESAAANFCGFIHKTYKQMNPPTT